MEVCFSYTLRLPHDGQLSISAQSRRGKLINWVEKASFEKIQKLLEISELERHHEVLLTLKNLGDLSHNSAPYSIPVIPCPLLTEIVEGEHYVTVDLLNLLPGSSSLAREPKAEAAGRELVIRTHPKQPSSASEDSDPTPQASRRGEKGSHLERLPLARNGSRLAPQVLKRREGTSGRQKVPGAGVEDFVPWVPPYPVIPRIGKKKRRGTKCLTRFITLLLGSESVMLASRERLMPSPRWPRVRGWMC